MATTFSTWTACPHVRWRVWQRTDALWERRCQGCSMVVRGAPEVIGVRQPTVER